MHAWCAASPLAACPLTLLPAHPPSRSPSCPHATPLDPAPPPSHLLVVMIISGLWLIALPSYFLGPSPWVGWLLRSVPVHVVVLLAFALLGLGEGLSMAPLMEDMMYARMYIRACVRICVHACMQTLTLQPHPAISPCHLTLHHPSPLSSHLSALTSHLSPSYLAPHTSPSPLTPHPSHQVIVLRSHRGGLHRLSLSHPYRRICIGGGHRTPRWIDSHSALRLQLGDDGARYHDQRVRS